MKNMFKIIPIVGPLTRRICRVLFNNSKSFQNSEEYWIQRYNSGGNSGAGSYSKLAEFKAEIINDYIKDNNITTIIEYGCGD